MMKLQFGPMRKMDAQGPLPQFGKLTVIQTDSADKLVKHIGPLTTAPCQVALMPQQSFDELALGEALPRTGNHLAFVLNGNHYTAYLQRRDLSNLGTAGLLQQMMRENDDVWYVEDVSGVVKGPEQRPASTAAPGQRLDRTG